MVCSLSRFCCSMANSRSSGVDRLLLSSGGGGMAIQLYWLVSSTIFFFTFPLAFIDCYLPLFDGQSPSFVLERLSPQRFETVQTNNDKLALLDGQAVPRLPVLLQKREILQCISTTFNQMSLSFNLVNPLTLTGSARTRLR